MPLAHLDRRRDVLIGHDAPDRIQDRVHRAQSTATDRTQFWTYVSMGRGAAPVDIDHTLRSTPLLAIRQHKQQTAAMPKSITIRDIPDETSEELAARAALTGRSLQEFLRARLVALAQEPDAEVWMARVRARKNTTGSALSVDQILAHRDADRA